MEIYIPTTDQEFSQRKIEEYAKFEKIINWGRKDPVHFAEEFFGIKLIDYQNGVLWSLGTNHLLYGYVPEVLVKQRLRRFIYRLKCC